MAPQGRSRASDKVGTAGSLQGQAACSVESGIAAKLRCLEFHLPEADRLRPSPRLGVDVTQKLGRRAKDAAAEDDLLRIEQADQVRHSHAPELDGLDDHLLCQRVALVAGGKDVPGGIEVVME